MIREYVEERDLTVRMCGRWSTERTSGTRAVHAVRYKTGTLLLIGLFE